MTVAQDSYGSVYECLFIPKDEHIDWLQGNHKRIDLMLEHPNGWKNSKVTRDDL